MKFGRPRRKAIRPILRRKIGSKIIGRRTIKATLRPRTAAHGGPKSIGHSSKPSSQLIVQVAKLAIPFKSISRQPKTREHCNENQAVPDLQTPADGLKDHFVQPSMQYPCPRRVVIKSGPSFLRRFETCTSSRF